MVGDPHRTPALLRAVMQAVRPGDIVLDIGTGLGVLAIAAAQAGARRVYALDVDRAALEVARAAARDAGVADQIEFVHALSFSYTPPECADVILCETVGSFAFDENICATLADAKRRFLKNGGRIVPQRLELWGALLSRLPRVTMPAEIGSAKRADLLGTPKLLATVEFRSRISRSLRLTARLRADRNGKALGLALWPRTIWWEGEVSDASPLAPPTHWKQGILPLEPRPVAAGKTLGIELLFQPHPDDPLRMTERLWRWM